MTICARLSSEIIQKDTTPAVGTVENVLWGGESRLTAGRGQNCPPSLPGRPVSDILGAVRLICFTLVAAVVVAAQTPANHDAGFWMERGKSALAEYRYRDAAVAFQKAIALSPNLAAAHAQLARSWLGQAPLNPLLVPDTEGFLSRAEAEARKAVDLSPADAESLSALASVVYKLAKATREPAEQSVHWAEATSLWNKVLAADPRSAQAHTELAHIAMEKLAPAFIMARAQSRMALQEKGPMRDPAVRRNLRRNYGQAIDDAIMHAEKALAIDPAYVPAMRVLATALLMRAAVSDSETDYAADFKASENWQRKAADATPQPAAAPGPLPNNAAIIGAMISQFSGTPGTTIVFAPPEVAERRLLSKIEPTYPEAARKAGVQGTVRFRAVIGTDGHVKTLDLVGGDPRLVQAAEEAVRRWVYRPFVADGVTREAATGISVPFKLDAASQQSK